MEELKNQMEMISIKWNLIVLNAISWNTITLIGIHIGYGMHSLNGIQIGIPLYEMGVSATKSDLRAASIKLVLIEINWE